MDVTVGQVLDAIDAVAPFRTAYEWDNCGLQVGERATKVTGVVIALETNPRVERFAKARGCNLIVVHHPLVLQPVRSVATDTPVGRRLASLVKSDISLIAAHTNIDCSPVGTNAALACRLGCVPPFSVIEPRDAAPEYKLVVFVPDAYTGPLIEAIHRGGGGVIGEYSHCTFRSPGTGTYVPGEKARPFSGERGRLEEAGENRLEAVVPAAALGSVLREARTAHPYEEMAYDVYPLHRAEARYGLGAIATLPQPLTLRQLADEVTRVCRADATLVAGPMSKTVRRIAIITGSPGSSLRLVRTGAADAVVTGEISYHVAMETVERGLGIVAAGHAATEKIFADSLRTALVAQLGLSSSDCKFLIFSDFHDPLKPVCREES